MSVTIAQVAREAGVSRSTVSLVLQAHPRVAADTRARVRATMERLGYRPNPMAAGLRTKRSGIAGLIVSDLTFPHHALIAMGVEDVLEQAGRNLIVANSHGSLERERRLVGALRQSRVDGLLVAALDAPEGSFAHLAALRQEGYPLVTVYRDVPDVAVDYCGVDVRAATEELVGYLAGTLGHRRVALIVGRPWTPSNRWRIEGWRRGLETHGLPAPDDLLVQTSTTGAGGEAGVGALVERGIPFTAVVCGNDLVAQGALRGLARAGMRVPEDVSVAGMGNFGEYTSPEKPLTTIGFDYRTIGRQAGTLLLLRIGSAATSSAATLAARDDGVPATRLLVPATLNVGETTAPLRQ